MPIRGDAEDLSQLELLRSSCPSGDVEWILVVDGEPTELVCGVTLELARRPDVVVLSQSCLNPGSARNAGLASACGDFVAFLDVDDEASIGAYLALCLELAAHGIMVGAIGYREVNEASSSPHEQGLPRSGDQVGWALLQRRVGIWRFAFSRAFLQSAGVRFPEASYGEDLQFVVCVLTHSPRVWGLARVGYTYRHHSGTQLTRQSPSASDVGKLWRFLEESLIANSANPAARHVLQSWLARIWARSLRLETWTPAPQVRIHHAALITRGLAWSCLWALREPKALVISFRSKLLRGSTTTGRAGEKS